MTIRSSLHVQTLNEKKLTQFSEIQKLHFYVLLSTLSTAAIYKVGPPKEQRYTLKTANSRHNLVKNRRLRRKLKEKDMKKGCKK
jgi:hypothetical protein